MGIRSQELVLLSLVRVSMKSPVLKWLLGCNYCEMTDPPPFINGSAHHSGSVEEPLGGGPVQGSGWGKKGYSAPV